MNEVISARSCERAEDLISFFYGELDEQEARSFDQHRRNCLVCEAELAGFGSVHESVMAWRDQTFGLSSRASLVNSEVAPLAQTTKRSALAAIRGFLELSPVWLKTATAFAAVMFCLLAGLAVYRSIEKTPNATVTSVTAPYTTKEFAAEVNRRVEAELAPRKEKESSIAGVKSNITQENTVHSSYANQRPERIVNQPAPKLSKPLTRAERDQLAADLRLISDDYEDSLELLGDRINNRY